jgi:NADH dehydrogenase
MQDIHILGGGFAGVWAAMSAAAERHSQAAEAINIELISKTPDLIIRPRLYQGASDSLRVPLAPLMKEIGVAFSQAEVSDIDPAARTYRCAGAETRHYDRLVLATGSELRQPPIPGIQENAWSIDNFAETERLDRHLERLSPDDCAAASIVIVGAGFTGLELATELRSRLGAGMRIILVDPSPKVGSELGPGLIPLIEEAVVESNIETRLGTRVAAVLPDAVQLTSGERIKSRTVIMTTGLVASPLTRCIGGEYDSYGRLKVDSDLKVSGIDGVFAAGDVAHALADDRHATYLSCQHAIQLGLFAGYNALHDLLGNEQKEYSQPFYATCIDLGKWGAVYSTGWERVVEKSRGEGKEIKEQINNEWIVPPSPALGKHQIFKQIALASD